MWVRRGIWKPRRRKRRERWGGAGEGLLGLSLEEVSPIRLALGPGTDSSLCFGPPRGEESLGPRDIPAQSLHCPLLGTPPWVLDPWNSLLHLPPEGKPQTEAPGAGVQGPCGGVNGAVGGKRRRGEGWGPSLVLSPQPHKPVGLPENVLMSKIVLTTVSQIPKCEGWKLDTETAQA